MTKREQAERWILSHCGNSAVSPTGQGRPQGLSKWLIKRTLQDLMEDGRVISGTIVDSDNAGYSLVNVRCSEPQ